MSGVVNDLQSDDIRNCHLRLARRFLTLEKQQGGAPPTAIGKASLCLSSTLICRGTADLTVPRTCVVQLHHHPLGSWHGFPVQ